MGQESAATTTTTNGAGARPHAVVMPYPLQGHVIPAVHLALRLAERGFSITFVNTESVHHQIGAGDDIFAGARASASSGQAKELDVRYELVSDGFPLSFDRSLNHDQFMEGVLHVLPAHVEELLRRVVTDPATTCLVIDTFYVWPATLARKLGVPYVSFWTEPALIFNLYYHMDLLTQNGHFKCKGLASVVIRPRSKAICWLATFTWAHQGFHCWNHGRHLVYTGLQGVAVICYGVRDAPG